MSRPLRIEFPGAFYHVMNRGLAHQEIFKTDYDRQDFLDLVGDVHSRWNLQTYSYCLMNNHYHLCVQTPTVSLAKVIRHMDGVYTQRFNRRHGRDGPLFRGRYKAILVEADRYLLAVARYIHQNPVEAGHVSLPEQYRWSSLRYYLSEQGKPSWIDTDTLLSYFGGRRKELLKFMQGKVEKEMVDFYGSKRGGPILGSESFRQWLQRQNKTSKLDREIPERRYLAVKLDACLNAVAQVCETEEHNIVKPRRGFNNIPRQIAMYICREVGGYSHREIAKKLNAGSYSTVSSACVVMKQRIRADRAMGERVRKVCDLLLTMYGHQAT